MNHSDPSGHDVSGDGHYGAGGADKDLGIMIIVTAIVFMLTVSGVGPLVAGITLIGVGAYMAIDGAYQQDQALKSDAPKHIKSSDEGFLKGGGIAGGMFLNLNDNGEVLYQDFNSQTGQWLGGLYPGPPKFPTGTNPNPHY